MSSLCSLSRQPSHWSPCLCFVPLNQSSMPPCALFKTQFWLKIFTWHPSPPSEQDLSHFWRHMRTSMTWLFLPTTLMVHSTVSDLISPTQSLVDMPLGLCTCPSLPGMPFCSCHPCLGITLLWQLSLSSPDGITLPSSSGLRYLLHTSIVVCVP